MAANCTGSDSLGLSNKIEPAEDLWEKALQRLDSPEFASLRSHTTEKRQTLEEVLRIVRQKEQICKEKRWKWKNGKGNVIIVRDIFAKMVAWIERFKAVGDTIIQYDPGHATLPWAAMRFVLQVAVNDVRSFGAMAEGLETVVQLILRYDVVERLYLQGNSTLVEQLRRRIEELSTSVLAYLLDANRYYSRKTTGRIASSILHVSDVRVDELLSRIKYKQDEIDRYLSIVSDQMLNNVHQLILNQDKDNLKLILESLCAPVPRIASQLSTIDDYFKREERYQVFEWLSSIPYTKHHRSKTRALLPGSGHWLLKKREFIEWIKTSSSSILWLHGIPGSGKSMLVAHVVEYIENQTPSCCESASIAYFYCARNANEPERADPEELLRSIVEQISSSDEEMPIREPVANAYCAKKKESKGRKPEKLSLEGSVDVIVDLLKTNPGTIIIDGLDECEPTLRQGLLDALAAIIKESDNVVKIFVSSRDDHDLVYRLAETPNLYIQATDNAVDIRRFVLTRVDEAISKRRILSDVYQAISGISSHLP